MQIIYRGTSAVFSSSLYKQAFKGYLSWSVYLSSLEFSFFFAPYISYTLFSPRSSYCITICSTFSKIILLISAQGKEVRDIVCLKFTCKSWIMIFEGFFLSVNHQRVFTRYLSAQNYFYIGCSFWSKLKWKYFPIRLN